MSEANQEDAPNPCREGIRAHSDPLWDGARPRALIIDARPARAELISSMLETQGIETSCVADSGALGDEEDPEAQRFDLVVSEYRLAATRGDRLFLHLLRCADDPLGPAERSELVELPFSIEELIAALGRVLVESPPEGNHERQRLTSSVWMVGFDSSSSCPEPTVEVGSAAETRTVRALTRRGPA